MGDLHAYDIANAAWADLSTPSAGTAPVGRLGSGMGAFDGKVYVFYGIDGSLRLIVM